MREETKWAFGLGLAAAIVASGAIDAAMQDDGASDTSAKAGSGARASTEPSPTPSSEPPATPSPTPTPAQASAAADDEPDEICYPVQTLEPLPRITAVVDPRTGVKTFKETYEDTEPPEPVCVSLYSPSYNYPYSYSPPYSSQVLPTNAPGYGPGFGGAGSGSGTGWEKDRRVPIMTGRGGMPDFAPTVPRPPAPRVPAFIP